MVYSETVRSRITLENYDENCTIMLEEIKEKRDLMIDCANTKGYTNDDTIKYSQELDQLINEYQKALRISCKSNEEVKFAFKQMIMVLPKVLG